MLKLFVLLLFSVLSRADRYSFEWTAGNVDYTCTGLKGQGWTRFGSQCVLFSKKFVPWFDARDICKREYFGSAPLSEQNWLALRQIATDNHLVWTGLQSHTPSELLDNGAATSIFNPAWSDNDPARRPEGECVAMDLSPLTEKSHGWTYKSCDVQLSVACESFACVGDEFRCADNSACIPRAFVGDGIVDCSDGSDEVKKKKKKSMIATSFEVEGRNSSWISSRFIDECALHPCSEHGICVNGECECQHGYFGERCTLFKCEIDSDCWNGGTCTSDRCFCAAGFDGKDCTRRDDHVCLNYCEHDGTCSEKANGDPQCKCLEGWEGDQCEIRAEIPFTMSNLFVNEQAPIQSIVNFPATKAFGYCGWVRPFPDETGGRTVILTMLGDLSVISLTSTGFEIRTKSSTLWTTYFALPNYEWSLVCMRCDDTRCNFYYNGFFENFGDKINESIGDSYYAAALTTTQDPYNKRVSGYLNQFEVYSSIDQDQIKSTYTNCSSFVSNRDPADTLIHWSQFLGAYPDEDKSDPGQCESIEDPDAPNGASSSPEPPEPNPDRVPPIATSCPDNQYLISTNRLTTVSWTELEWSDPDNIVSIESNFRNGDVFYWGDFHVVYTAQDKAGSVGRCEFDVFIAPNECKIPDYARYSGDNGTMTLTNTLASKVGSYYAASVTCTDPRFPLPGPQLYTCDVMGQWHRSVSAPAITLPVCGVTDDPIQIISGYVIYDDTENCTERHDMILSAMEGVLNAIPSSECVGTHTPEDGCYTLTMTTCAELGILTFDEFFIDEDEANMRFNFTIEIKSPNIDLNGAIFNAISILLDGTHSSVDTYPTEFACSSAYPVHMREDYNEYCTQTSPGNYNNNGTMEPCPSGTYSTDVNANSCTKCAGNYTTMYQGATSERDCYVNCPKGFYTTFANRDACIPCQIGTYEDEEGGLDQCLSCNGNSTMRTASTSQADCVNTCDKLGQEMDENGNCVPCPQGWYKADISHLRCDEQCPYGLSTDGDGATSKNSCTQLYCPPNRTPSTDTTLTPPNPSSFNLDTYCPLCSRGFAQPAANQTTCVACITINDISPFSSCASECEGTEDQKSCKDGYHCALIFQSPGYYECTKYASAPDADNNGVRWWLIALIAVGVVIVAVLIVILVWCIFKRRVCPCLQKEKITPEEEIAEAARRATVEIMPEADSVPDTRVPASPIDLSEFEAIETIVFDTPVQDPREVTGIPYLRSGPRPSEGGFGDEIQALSGGQMTRITPPISKATSHEESQYGSSLPSTVARVRAVRPTQSVDSASLDAGTIYSRDLGTATLNEFSLTLSQKKVLTRPVLTVQTIGLEPALSDRTFDLPSQPSGMNNLIVPDHLGDDLPSSAFNIPSIPHTPITMPQVAMRSKARDSLLVADRLGDLPSSAFNIPSLPTTPVPQPAAGEPKRPTPPASEGGGGASRMSTLRPRMPTIPDVDFDIPSLSSRSSDSSFL